LNIQKAFEIKDAQIQFVSLVDKAANKKQFLITKAKKGRAEFTAYGRVVKTDEANHYITGIVYEPMAEDSHGNYMTEAEITKAAYWFAKHGDSVDLQHSFEALESATVVENWIAKADFEIDGETVKKGTWLTTVEVNDDAVWEAVRKGAITGFSMGGFGTYSEEDTQLDEISKKTTATEEPGADEKQGVLKKLAAMLGLDTVTKGVMADEYEKRSKSTLFWNAFYTLEDVLYRYNRFSDKWEFESDEATIREALAEFSAIAMSILAGGDGIAKSLAEGIPVEKAGKKMSGKNRDALKTIYDNLGSFLSEFDDTNQEEDNDVKKSELQTIVDEAVKKAARNSAEQTDGDRAAEGAGKAEATAAAEPVTAEAVQKMVDAAVQKALAPDDEALTPEAIQTLVSEAVAKAVEPVLKSRGVPSNLSDGQNPVGKSSEEPHYLKGVL
jgi:chromatin remodeling complex protein RSC6